MNVSAEMLMAFPCAFCRILGAVALLPLGGSTISFFRSISIAFAMTCFFLPDLQSQSASSWYGLLGEFMIGIVIGLPAALLIDLVRSLGDLFDLQRGVNFATLYDPVSNNNISLMSVLGANYTTAILIASGILEQIFNAIKNSWILLPLPIDEIQLISSISLNIVNYISVVFSGMLGVFLVLAVVFSTVDIFSLFLSRVLTHAGLNSEAFQIKTFLGILAIIALFRFNLESSLTRLSTPQMGFFRAF